MAVLSLSPSPPHVVRSNGEIPMKGSKVLLEGMKYPELEEMIIASENRTSKLQEKHFLYDIVANVRNGIDVYKFDYTVRDSRVCGLGCNFQFQRVLETMRVIDDEIYYRAKEYLTIHKLFAARADSHHTIYTHAKVKAIELMFVDAMTKANDILRISSYIDEPALYWKDLKESRDLILRIRTRDLYQNSSRPTINEEDVVMCNTKIDLTQGRNNPLERHYKQILQKIVVDSLRRQTHEITFPFPVFMCSRSPASAFSSKPMKLLRKKKERRS